MDGHGSCAVYIMVIIGILCRRDTLGHLTWYMLAGCSYAGFLRSKSKGKTLTIWVIW